MASSSPSASAGPPAPARPGAAAALVPLSIAPFRGKGLMNTSQLGGEGRVGPRVRCDCFHGGLPHGGRRRR
jgi:hypothetical protein